MTDKEVQVMADCNSGKITHEEAEAMLGDKYKSKKKSNNK